MTRMCRASNQFTVRFRVPACLIFSTIQALQPVQVDLSISFPCNPWIPSLDASLFLQLLVFLIPTLPYDHAQHSRCHFSTFRQQLQDFNLDMHQLRATITIWPPTISRTKTRIPEIHHFRQALSLIPDIGPFTTAPYPRLPFRSPRTPEQAEWTTIRQQGAKGAWRRLPGDADRLSHDA